ncbi:isochorismatase family protein [Roseateles violae]|uniref:Isochorismatase family protein n=1 Tax=Roseateles violae TaxID=3058042 RepID=A0ABT8DLN6_9BURK|nr:isochorismatase family protein [Pelomonas sp. PFR6]MDN3919315.1 isochorismatase family protein [Pelomonas sp. PFR6]
MNTALLVIDLQRGAFDGVRCPAIDAPERLLGHARRLLDAARAGGRTIVFVQHSENVAGEVFEEATEHWRLHETLQPDGGPRESSLRKYASSAFENTDLDARLKAQGADELVICGLQSEFCVSNTSRAALALGYRVRLAQDAHGTWPSEGRSAEAIRAEVNAALSAAGAEPATTAELERLLSGSLSSSSSSLR